MLLLSTAIPVGRSWDAASVRTPPPKRETEDTVPPLTDVMKMLSALTAMYVWEVMVVSDVKQRAAEHPPGHVFVQPPQWSLSAWRSAQVSGHMVCPAVVHVQLPALQLAPGTHDSVHARLPPVPGAPPELTEPPPLPPP